MKIVYLTIIYVGVLIEGYLKFIEPKPEKQLKIRSKDELNS